MSCPLLSRSSRRAPAPGSPEPLGVPVPEGVGTPATGPLPGHPAGGAWRARLGDRLRREDAPTQFARFVLVGGTSSLVYALLFVALLGLGTQPANIGGAVVSTVLANELHRRLTFHAGARVAWFTAQVEGGGLTLVGMAATSLALAALTAWAGDAHPTVQLLVIGAVTGAVGLVRFATLRWLFRPRPAAAAPVATATADPVTVGLAEAADGPAGDAVHA